MSGQRMNLTDAVFLEGESSSAFTDAKALTLKEFASRILNELGTEEGLKEVIRIFGSHLLGAAITLQKEKDFILRFGGGSYIVVHPVIPKREERPHAGSQSEREDPRRG